VTAVPSRRHSGCDGTQWPLTSGDTTCDGRDACPPGRHNRHVPPAKGPHLTAKPNHPSQRNTEQINTTNTYRSADHEPPVPTDDPPCSNTAPDTDGTNDTADTDRIPRPRQSTSTPRARMAVRRTNRQRTGDYTGRLPGRASADLADTAPTPEQWAQEQLKHAPQRSRAWARAVATIYGLDISKE
jgi:hypothetical protein